MPLAFEAYMMVSQNMRVWAVAKDTRHSATIARAKRIFLLFLFLKKDFQKGKKKRIFFYKKYIKSIHTNKSEW